MKLIVKIWLKRLFCIALTRDEFRSTIARTGRTIDFTRRGWGHTLGNGYAFCTPALKDGDILVTERGRFLAHSVKPCYDPPDMVFFSCIAETD